MLLMLVLLLQLLLVCEPGNTACSVWVADPGPCSLSLLMAFGASLVGKLPLPAQHHPVQELLGELWCNTKPVQMFQTVQWGAH